MGELANWAKSQSQFIKILDGETIEATYKGATKTISTFDNKSSTICYNFDDKLFNSASKKLAEVFDDIPVGSRVRVTRIGIAQGTRYEVEVLATTGEANENSLHS